MLYFVLFLVPLELPRYHIPTAIPLPGGDTFFCSAQFATLEPALRSVVARGGTDDDDEDVEMMSMLMKEMR